MRPQNPLVLEAQPLGGGLRLDVLRVGEPLTPPQAQTALRRVVQDTVHGQTGCVAEHVRALKLGQDDDPCELRLRVLDGRVGVAERSGELVLVLRGEMCVGTGWGGVDGVGQEGLGGQRASMTDRGRWVCGRWLTGSRRFFSAQMRTSSTLFTFNGSQSASDGFAMNASASNWAWSDGWS